jgi:hypothetical protein
LLKQGVHTCPFAVDYKSMIELVRTLGPANGAPKIYTAIPPPLMQQGAYGMVLWSASVPCSRLIVPVSKNQSVINDVFPVLVPAINKDNNVGTEPIDVFTALGGDKDWKTTYPKSCSLQTASVRPARHRTQEHCTSYMSIYCAYAIAFACACTCKCSRDRAVAVLMTYICDMNMHIRMPSARFFAISRAAISAILTMMDTRPWLLP